MEPLPQKQETQTLHAWRLAFLYAWYLLDSGRLLGRLAGWVAGCWLGWLVGWLAGWLAGWLGFQLSEDFVDLAWMESWQGSLSDLALLQGVRGLLERGLNHGVEHARRLECSADVVSWGCLFNVMFNVVAVPTTRRAHLHHWAFPFIGVAQDPGPQGWGPATVQDPGHSAIRSYRAPMIFPTCGRSILFCAS